MGVTGHFEIFFFKKPLFPIAMHTKTRMLFGQHFDGEVPRNLNHVFLKPFEHGFNKKIGTFMFKSRTDGATLTRLRSPCGFFFSRDFPVENSRKLFSVNVPTFTSKVFRWSFWICCWEASERATFPRGKIQKITPTNQNIVRLSSGMGKSS